MNAVNAGGMGGMQMGGMPLKPEDSLSRLFNDVKKQQPNT